MIIFAKICISDDYRGFILLFVHPAFFLLSQRNTCVYFDSPFLLYILKNPAKKISRTIFIKKKDSQAISTTWSVVPQTLKRTFIPPKNNP